MCLWNYAEKSWSKSALFWWRWGRRSERTGTSVPTGSLEWSLWMPSEMWRWSDACQRNFNTKKTSSRNLGFNRPCSLPQYCKMLSSGKRIFGVHRETPRECPCCSAEKVTMFSNSSRHSSYSLEMALPNSHISHSSTTVQGCPEDVILWWLHHSILHRTTLFRGNNIL